MRGRFRKRYLLISLLLFCPQSNGDQSRNHKSDNSQQQQQPQNGRGSEQSPLVIKILPADQQPNESQTSGEKRRQSEWRLSDRIAVIATIVGFLQFCALVCTILVMVRGGRRQLRAYVLPESAGLFDGTTVNPPQPHRANIPGIAMLFKNGGQTPAYKVVSFLQISVIAVANENTLVVPLIEERFPLTLGGGGTYSKHVWFDRPLTPTEITDIATGVRAIYGYGRIEYRDAFKRKRYTSFRLHFVGVFPPPPTAILNFSDKGNDAT